MCAVRFGSKISGGGNNIQAQKYRQRSVSENQHVGVTGLIPYLHLLETAHSSCSLVGFINTRASLHLLSSCLMVLRFILEGNRWGSCVFAICSIYHPRGGTCFISLFFFGRGGYCRPYGPFSYISSSVVHLRTACGQVQLPAATYTWSRDGGFELGTKEIY